MDSLSFCWSGFDPRVNVVSEPHVSPPSIDLLTVIALSKSPPLKLSAIWYAAPFGENVTQGSEARSKSPPLPVFPPEQNVNGAHDWLQVVPPSWVTEATRPRAPPF